MVEITIEFCATCRVGEEAVALQRTLSDFLHRRDGIDRITLAPTSEERICVSVDGDRIWCVPADEQVDPMDALAAVRSQLSA